MKIRVLLTGRSYHNAAELPSEFELAEGANLSDALVAINTQLPEGVSLPPSCLIAIGGRHVGSVGSYPDQPLADGQELTLVAPVAGG